MSRVSSRCGRGGRGSGPAFRESEDEAVRVEAPGEAAMRGVKSHGTEGHMLKRDVQSDERRKD